MYLAQSYDKDCLENIRVYLTAQGQGIVDRAINVKCTKAEVIWIFSDIEPVPFNRGFYSVDLKYFFRITLAVFTGLGRPIEVEGLATFDKKVILFGSEGNAKIFASKYKEDAFDSQLWRKTNMPSAVVEVVDNKMYYRANCIPLVYCKDVLIKILPINKMAHTTVAINMCGGCFIANIYIFLKLKNAKYYKKMGLSVIDGSPFLVVKKY